jgi:malonyl-CoA O-methyltransferase
MKRASTLEVYERWAPGYPAHPHNPLMAAEQQAMLARCPRLAGRDVLDLACGTGRYALLARRAGARCVAALDRSPGMLARVDSAWPIRGDLDALPLRDATFDVVISGLALGHAIDLVACIEGVGRVLRPGGVLLYSDFHPEATRRGLRRGFRDGTGRRFEVPPDGHSLEAHFQALSRAAFSTVELSVLRAGIEVCGEFDGADSFYREWHGTPLAFVMLARLMS